MYNIKMKISPKFLAYSIKIKISPKSIVYSIKVKGGRKFSIRIKLFPKKNSE